jgi:hypothetical protein
LTSQSFLKASSPTAVVAFEDAFVLAHDVMSQSFLPEVVSSNVCEGPKFNGTFIPHGSQSFLPEVVISNSGGQQPDAREDHCVPGQIDHADRPSSQKPIHRSRGTGPSISLLIRDRSSSSIEGFFHARGIRNAEANWRGERRPHTGNIHHAGSFDIYVATKGNASIRPHGAGSARLDCWRGRKETGQPI